MTDILNITTLRNEIVILQDDVVQKTSSNIILTNDLRSHKRPNRGVVVAGNIRTSEELPVGSKVFFSRYAGRNIKFGDKDYIIMDLAEVFGTVDADTNVDAGETFDYQEMMQNLNVDKMKEDFGQD